jgi:hypothetical protein
MLKWVIQGARARAAAAIVALLLLGQASYGVNVTVSIDDGPTPNPIPANGMPSDTHLSAADSDPPTPGMSCFMYQPTWTWEVASVKYSVNNTTFGAPPNGDHSEMITGDGESPWKATLEVTVGAGGSGVGGYWRYDVKATVEYMDSCNNTWSGFGDKNVDVIAISVDSLLVSLPSTRNPVTGARPAAGTQTTANRAPTFADDIVVTQDAATVTVTAQNLLPAAQAGAVKWQMDRNPADIVAGAVPGLNPAAGAQTTFAPSANGSFRLICYVDANGNGRWDAGEELRVARICIVLLQVQDAAPTFTMRNAFAGGASRVSCAGGNFMTLRVSVLRQGGGADGRMGNTKITLGNVGNCTGDTFVVTYPGTAADPRVGTASEDPDYQINPAAGFPNPMLDSVNVAHGATATGGTSPFRGNSAFAVTTAQNPLVNGGGDVCDVTSLDAPVFAWPNLHPTTGNVWGSTTGNNAFREVICGFSTDFNRNYYVVASANWTVTANGTRVAGVWRDNGTSSCAGGPLGAGRNTGDASGAQFLGASFVSEYGFIIAP